MGLIISILFGAVAGYIASKLQSGESKGFLINTFLGILGAAVGSWLFTLLGLQAAVGGLTWLGELVVAVVGAVIVLWVFNKLK